MQDFPVPSGTSARTLTGETGKQYHKHVIMSNLPCWCVWVESGCYYYGCCDCLAFLGYAHPEKVKVNISTTDPD